jgi:hypothetical protein
MTRRAGSADLPLHGGRVPIWLGERMTRFGAVIAEAIGHEFGRGELLRVRRRDGDGLAFLRHHTHRARFAGFCFLAPVKQSVLLRIVLDPYKLHMMRERKIVPTPVRQDARARKVAHRRGQSMACPQLADGGGESKLQHPTTNHTAGRA